MLALVVGAVAGCSMLNAYATDSPSPQYVPLIGITSVPNSLALPKEGGSVTYNYAVKNFLQEAPLTNVTVNDDTCSPIKFIGGDDNHNSKLDFGETWRYSCTTRLVTTTLSTATASGTANDLTATHRAYAMVAVGSTKPFPLVSIVNITKVSYPLSLPAQGGKITFTYRVSNPGVVPLSYVTVTDNKCSAMSGQLGDRNGNGLLDIDEVWVYTCSTVLTQTTTNTVHVSAFSNGLEAIGDATITVQVASSPNTASQSLPGFPVTGASFVFNSIVWEAAAALIVALLMVYFILRHRRIKGNSHARFSSWFAAMVLVVVIAALLGFGFHFLVLPRLVQTAATTSVGDNLFGWAFPVSKFPITGSGSQVAYSSIRDPGGIPKGLPVRLKIPSINVDSAIEDALITSDGRMDVPAGSVDVAWFALGPSPGQTGSAVIGGHFGIQNGVPFVFYDLDKLKAGDKVNIVDDRNDTLTFIVRHVALFDRNASATTVFTSTDGLSHLNLITCEGVWNQVNGTYPQRRVVFTDLVPTVAAAPVSSSLSVGSVGADVIALQTFLIERGFLVLPAGVAKGTFGGSTKVAVADYQTSVGLPSTGIFDPTTRASLQTVVAVDGNIPPPSNTPTPVPSATPQPPSFLISYTQSLYASPTDGVITTILLIVLVCAALVFIRQFRRRTRQ